MPMTIDKMLYRPCQGRAVRLCLTVQQFFCGTPVCPRRTFAEPFSELAPACARRTAHQGKSFAEIAFAPDGRAGTRLACLLGLPVSFWTLLRLLRRKRRKADCTVTRNPGGEASDRNNLCGMG